MSVLWEQVSDETCYSVRQSGASIRLYTNQVFHSQWNPNRPFAGGVWDCLSLPTLYRPKEQTKRVLLLGVGGGAVIRQLECLVPFTSLVGVELDACHIAIAKRWFGVTDSRVQWVQGDAVAWLQNYQGPQFDLIIDDLFGHQDGEPVRANLLTTNWVELLGYHLSSGGVAIINCLHAKELKNAQSQFSDAEFSSGFRWMQPAYENAVGVFSMRPLVAREWSRRLEETTLSSSSQRIARAIQRRPLRDLGTN